MKTFKYPYGLFVFSIIIFIGGIILEIKTFEEVKHIPVTFASSIISFVLLIFGFIHLAIYKKVLAEKYLVKFAKVVYWFGTLLFMCVLLNVFMFTFDLSVRAVYEKLFLLYFICHPILLVWLLVDLIVGFKS